MTDITAQTFRERAADALSRNEPEWGNLLLAAAEQREQLEALKDDRETLELKLAACTAAALGNTATTVQERIEPGHPYYSATYGDVCHAVDREMDFRADNVGLKTIVELLNEQIATLTARIAELEGKK